MEKRISRDSLNMQIALLYSKRATCDRLHVGAVLVMDKRIIATGYNGPAINQPHCSDEACDKNKSCERAVHAEANIIAFCARHGIHTLGSTLFVTHSPCITCAKLIIQSGITRVVFGQVFRDSAGLKLLLDSGLIIDRAAYNENNFQNAFEFLGLYHITEIA